jgi:hypothetical protein
MSTIAKESGRAPVALPSVGRGESLFGLVAVVIGVLALVARFSGLFG